MYSCCKLCLSARRQASQSLSYMMQLLNFSLALMRLISDTPYQWGRSVLERSVGVWHVVRVVIDSHSCFNDPMSATLSTTTQPYDHPAQVWCFENGATLHTLSEAAADKLTSAGEELVHLHADYHVFSDNVRQGYCTSKRS